MISTSGIYALVNTSTQGVYVGSSINLHKRKLGHFRTFRRGRANKKIQEDVDKFGAESFTFVVIELCSRSELKEREQFWIDKFNSVAVGYNVCPVAYSCIGYKHAQSTKEKLKSSWTEERRSFHLKMVTGRIFSEEERLKMSQAATGRKATDEARHNMSIAQKRKYEDNPSLREAIAESSRGRRHSPEVIEKVRQFHLGRKRSAETCACISQSLTSEVRKRIAISKLGKAMSEEAKANMSRAQVGRKHSAETREKMRQTHLRKKAEKHDANE